MPLICDRCGHEIKSGSKVSIISTDPDAENRIIVGDDAIVVHATCPEEGE